MTLTWVSPGGEETVLWPATGDLYLEGRTLEGFTGVWQDNPTAVIGEPGGRVDRRNIVVEQMTGTFTLRVKTSVAWQRLRRMFSPLNAGTLIIDGWELPCRLAAGLPAPGVIPRRGASVAVSLVSDVGVWVKPMSGMGSVTVTNHGDVPVWPTIAWDGAGGPVILPSGATFALPAVPSPRVVDLTRSSSGVVRDDSGRVDREVTRKLLMIAECVPVGGTAKFTAPEGATLHWGIGVLDVFREVSWS